MCLYPTIRKNKKYEVNKKNGGIVPPLIDSRTLYVPTKCGECMECRRAKARDWRIRLKEEIKENKNGKYVTLTFSEENLHNLREEAVKQQTKILNEAGAADKKRKKRAQEKMQGYGIENQAATIAVRRFTERYRKKYDTHPRHWLITELGHKGTERIHLHGIIWCEQDLNEIEELWGYGWVWKGQRKNEKLINYVNGKTINYMTKYVMKVDQDHKTYKQKILNSKGIGRGYKNSYNSETNKYVPGETIEYYRDETGRKMALPIYYRNHLYTDEEREKLWIEKLDKDIRYVNGEKVSIKNGNDNYNKILGWHQKRNTELGYGTGEKKWKLEEYEKDRIEMMRSKRNPPGAPTGGG